VKYLNISVHLSLAYDFREELRAGLGLGVEIGCKDISGQECWSRTMSYLAKSWCSYKYTYFTYS